MSRVTSHQRRIIDLRESTEYQEAYDRLMAATPQRWRFMLRTVDALRLEGAERLAWDQAVKDRTFSYLAHLADPRSISCT